MKIVIDVGHTYDWYETYGDKGMILNGVKIEEYYLNKLIADDLFDILKEQNITVYKTPTYQKPCKKGVKYIEASRYDLNTRTDYINKINPTLSVSLHHDWNKNSNSRGYTIYKYKYNNTTKIYKERIGKRLKSRVSGIKECSLNNNGYSECYKGHQGFAMIMNPTCNAILIENGFFSSQTDVNLTKKLHFKFALAIAEGILNKTINLNQYIYKVQAGAYSLEKNAKDQVDKLKNKGFDAFYTKEKK